MQQVGQNGYDNISDIDNLFIEVAEKVEDVGEAGKKVEGLGQLKDHNVNPAGDLNPPVKQQAEEINAKAQIVLDQVPENIQDLSDIENQIDQNLDEARDTAEKTHKKAIHSDPFVPSADIPPIPDDDLANEPLPPFPQPPVVNDGNAPIHQPQQPAQPPQPQPAPKPHIQTLQETLSSKVAQYKANGDVKISAKLDKNPDGSYKIEEHTDPRYPGRIAYKIQAFYTIKGKDKDGNPESESLPGNYLYTNAINPEEALSALLDGKDIYKQIALQSQGIGGDHAWARLNEDEKTTIIGHLLVSKQLKISTERDPQQGVLRVKSFQAVKDGALVDNSIGFSKSDKKYRIDLSNKFQAKRISLEDPKQELKPLKGFVTDKSGKIRKALHFVKNKETLDDLRKTANEAEKYSVIGAHVHNLDEQHQYLKEELQQILENLNLTGIKSTFARVFPGITPLKQVKDLNEFLRNYEGKFADEVKGSPSEAALEYIKAEKTISKIQKQIETYQKLEKALNQLNAGPGLQTFLGHAKNTLELSQVPTEEELRQILAQRNSALKTNLEDAKKTYVTKKKEVEKEREPVVHLQAHLKDIQQSREDQLKHLESLKKEVQAERDKAPDLGEQKSLKADLTRIDSLIKEVKEEQAKVKKFNKLVDKLSGVTDDQNDLFSF